MADQLLPITLGTVINPPPEQDGVCSYEKHGRRMRFVIGDRETCGLGEQNMACEIALLEIDPETLEPIGEWYSLIDPQMEIAPQAEAIHGISNAMVADEPTLAEFIEHRLCGAFDGCDITMIAHNMPFDFKELNKVGNVTRTICTLAWARQLIHDSPNHKLQDLGTFYGFPVDGAHSAAGDTRTTRLLLKKLLEISGRTLEQFAATPTRTYHTMPFGKHKGMLLFQVPKSYLEWMLTEGDWDPNLLESVKKVLRTK